MTAHNKCACVECEDTRRDHEAMEILRRRKWSVCHGDNGWYMRHNENIEAFRGNCHWIMPTTFHADPAEAVEAAEEWMKQQEGRE